MYGTHSQEISQFYLHTPRSSAIGMKHTCLCLPSQSWHSFTDPWGMEGWVGLGSLVGYIQKYTVSVRHRELNPDMIAHLSTNRVRRRWTSLIEVNALTTTPDHQRQAHEKPASIDACLKSIQLLEDYIWQYYYFNGRMR